MLAAALRAAAFVCGAFVVLLMLFVLRKSWPALNRPGLARFFADGSWHPQSESTSYGLTPMIAATASRNACPVEALVG